VLLYKNEAWLLARKYFARHASHSTKRIGKRLLRKLGYKI